MKLNEAISLPGCIAKVENDNNISIECADPKDQSKKLSFHKSAQQIIKDGIDGYEIITHKSSDSEIAGYIDLIYAYKL